MPQLENGSCVPIAVIPFQNIAIVSAGLYLGIAVLVKRLHADAMPPIRQSAGAAGFDLCVDNRRHATARTAAAAADWHSHCHTQTIHGHHQAQVRTGG